MKPSRQFLLIFFSLLLLLAIPVAAVNYKMDPLWTFQTTHKWNDHQLAIDERQQKTNYLYFHPVAFNTVLIGSSRSTYIDQHAFTKLNVYNYSANDMSIREYDTFLAFARQQSTRPVENVILGLDFFKSSVQESSRPFSLMNYKTRVEQPYYRYKNLFSLDTFKYSLQNLYMSMRNVVAKERVYNRENVARARRVSNEELEENTAEKIVRFQEEFYGSRYVYNPMYKKYLTIFNERHPDVNKIIYTTPISMELFEALIESGNYPDYEQWLRDLVDVYGGVYNFMYPNEVTEDLTNYFDGHHFYPEIGSRIARRITAGPEAESEFGVYVTEETIDAHLQMVRRELGDRLP